MKTLLRISIILLTALAVMGVTYAVSQSAWVTAQFAAAPGGGEGGEGRPERGTPPDFSANLASAAETLGVTAAALSEALGGMPPDYAQAAQTLGLPEAEVQTAVEASLAAGGFGTYYLTSREQLAKTKLAHEEAQRHAAEAQLKLLQTQLEPHMLFNTLANLRVLIGTNPALATDMLDRMVAYLRATLSASRASNHALQLEFDRLRDYLELMTVRMGPRLGYELDLPADLANLSVPALLLQPLVENSIKHGLEPKVEGGTITVRARRSYLASAAH